MNNKWLLFLVVAIAGGLIALFAVFNKGSNNSANPNGPVAVRPSPDGLPGLLTGNAPWPANTDKVGDRLTSIGLPQLSAEGTVLHIHQHLDIYVAGQKVSVPANIGIASSFISPIHVHDTSGVIHVESPTQQDFYLGQFFDIWGVKFDSADLGGYKASGDNQLSVFVNGTKVTSDPRQIKLAAHQEIVVVYGTTDQQPSPIPSSYDFPQGE